MPDESITSGEQQAGQEAAETEGSSIAHEDIMKRLLEYQRQLRDGVAESGAAEQAPSGSITITQTEEVQVVDLTEAEAELEEAEGAAEATVEVETDEGVTEATEAATKPETVTEPAQAGDVWATSSRTPTDTETSEGTADLADRVAALEDALTRVTQMVSELRDRFQDMAIASDEQLAAIERTLAAVAESADRN